MKRDGDDPTRVEESLVVEYAPLARAIASEFRLPGADREDVEAEAMIGVLEAIRSYRPELATDGGLRSWVAFVVRRNLYDALTAARRLKHGPLTDSIRDVVAEDGETVPILDVVADPRADVPDLVELRERVRRLRAAIPTLSPLERETIAFVANGGIYSRKGAGGTKKMENAVDRARRKLLAA